MIYESAEDKNRRKAMHYADEWLTKKGLKGKLQVTSERGTILKDADAIDNEVGKTVGNARKLANAKYMLGATRMYLDMTDGQDVANAAGSKLSKLNQIIELIAKDPGHLAEYDSNLNGLSFDELKKRFATAVTAAVDKDKETLASNTYQQNSEYEIVQIPNFDAASEYSRYTSWCVTHGESAYNSYTHDGTGIFYFCLKHGFEDVPAKRGEGCPLDEYGLSMIAVSVNDDGSLNTCTCRWNHSYGGNDHVMTTSEISELLGVNFYNTFKPRDIESILAEYRSRAIRDPFAEKMGWICIKGDAYDTFDYVVPTENRILKYRKAFDGISSSGLVVCVASDRLYWYDARSGRQINPPESITGVLKLCDMPQLVSLDGCPKEIEGTGRLDCSECPNLVDITNMPSKVKNIDFTGSFNIMKRTDIGKLMQNGEALRYLLFQDCSNVEVGSNKVSVELDLDDIRSVYSEDSRDSLSWEFVKKILEGEITFYYDHDVLDINQMDGDVFDAMLEEYGLDWGDISKIYDEGELKIDNVLTAYQSKLIYDMLINDFYEGDGIHFFYERCEESGTESEAYHTIVDDIISQMRLDKEHGFKDGKFKAVFDGAELRNFLKYYPYTSELKTAQRMMMDWNYVKDGFDPESDDAEDGVEKIRIYEPQYGFSGFDKRYWEEGVKNFAKKVIDILENPPTEDAEGQQFFDFDKEYRK